MDDDNDEEEGTRTKKKKKKVILIEEGGGNVSKHKNCNVYVSTNTGHVICYDLNNLFASEDFNLKIVE